MTDAAVAAFDVGGTALKSGLAVDGRLVGLTTAPTPGGRPADAGAHGDRALAVVDAIVAGVARAREAQAISAVGVVVPGIVHDGVGVHSENLGWRDVPFRSILEARLALPVTVEHDVASAAVAEWRLGALERAIGTSAVIVVGTGVAATTLVDGEPLRSVGWAGELGHTTVVEGGERCVCGALGCLEAVASAAAIARRHASATGTVGLDAAAVLAAAERGDETAARIWAEAIQGLACAIHQLAAIVAPERLAIAGGLSAAGDALLGPLARALEARLPSGVRRPRLVQARLGARAGLVGAALAAGAELHPDGVV